VTKIKERKKKGMKDEARERRLILDEGAFLLPCKPI